MRSRSRSLQGLASVRPPLDFSVFGGLPADFHRAFTRFNGATLPALLQLTGYTPLMAEMLIN